MTWGFSLLGALLLLFPGFCAWLGLRSGSRTDYLSPVPDKPNSTYTLFVVLFGSLLAHTAGAFLFAGQELYCRVGPCLRTDFDPDLYKAILLQDQVLAGSSVGIALALGFFVLLGMLTGLAFVKLGKSNALANIVRPDTQGWVRAIAQGATDPGKVVTAFVLTKTGNGGLFAAYEGVVQQLTLDEDQAITMIALAGVDRFLVEIADRNIRRLDTNTRPMPLIQILKAEIANVAFDIIDVSNLVYDEIPAPLMS